MLAGLLNVIYEDESSAGSRKVSSVFSGPNDCAITDAGVFSIRKSYLRHLNNSGKSNPIPMLGGTFYRA